MFVHVRAHAYARVREYGVCVRACVRVCACACVRACKRARAFACAHACAHIVHGCVCVMRVRAVRVRACACAVQDCPCPPYLPATPASRGRALVDGPWAEIGCGGPASSGQPPFLRPTRSGKPAPRRRRRAREPAHGGPPGPGRARGESNCGPCLRLFQVGPAASNFRTSFNFKALVRIARYMILMRLFAELLSWFLARWSAKHSKFDLNL